MSPDLAQQFTACRDPGDRERPAADDAVVDWRALRTAGRACCCPARPVVAAIIPPAPGRDHPTDLLLCAHHFRASWVALERARAAIFDGAGGRVTPAAWALLDGR